MGLISTWSRSTGTRLNPKYEVLKGAGNAQKLNFFIKREKLKIDQLILDLQNDEKEVTFEKVRKLYITDSSSDFIEFFGKRSACVRESFRIEDDLVKEEMEKWESF